VAQNEAERGKDVVSTGGGGSKVVPAKLALILHMGTPRVEICAPALHVVVRHDMLVRSAGVNRLARCFPRSGLERTDDEVVVCLGEAVGKAMPPTEINRIAHDEAEEGLFVAGGLVPLEAVPFVLAGCGPEVRGHGEWDADFLIADRRGVVYGKAEIGVYAENREREPERHRARLRLSHHFTS
jgi:hypothetical protein